MSRFKIGDAPNRREDQAFLTGAGRYLDDLAFAGMAHAAFVRSPHAHAEIRSIVTTEARRSPGVIAVLTAADLARDGLKALRPSYEINVKTGAPLAFMPQPLLAVGKVRYVGEPVALVVAETFALALDAAEKVSIDYRRCRDGAGRTAGRGRRVGQPGARLEDGRYGGCRCRDGERSARCHSAHRQPSHRDEPHGAARRHWQL
jgi:Aldehyde oxidase and xanthine dehydrogenase, a/b hammerhead domain